MISEIKSLTSHDLEFGQLPENPNDCSVSLIISIGPKNEDREETFYLEVITTHWLQRTQRPFWATRALIISCFDWQTVKQEIEQMLSQCTGDSWSDVEKRISYFLDTMD